jgi:hypothetical protein
VQPTDRLRQLLAHERDAGATFEDAWPRATSRVLAELEWTRETWHDIFEYGRDAWRRAYENRPRQGVDWLQPPDDPEPRSHESGRVELLA